MLILTDFLVAHCFDGLENNLLCGQNNMKIVWHSGFKILQIYTFLLEDK